MENQYHQLSHHQTLSAREAGHRVQDGLGGSTKVFNITRPLLFFRVRKSLKTNHWQEPHLRMLVDMGGWKRRQPLPVAPRTGAPPQLRQRQTGTGRDRRLVQLVQLATTPPSLLLPGRPAWTGCAARYIGDQLCKRLRCLVMLFFCVASTKIVSSVSLSSVRALTQIFEILEDFDFWNYWS